MATSIKSWLRLPENLLESVEMMPLEQRQSKGHYSNVEVSSVNSGDDVELLRDENKDEYHQPPRWLEKPVGYLCSRSKQFRAIVGVTLLLLVLLLSTASAKPDVIKDAYEHITNAGPPVVATEERMLYIITPGGHIELPTCRAILSSAVLQYPTMYLVDWNVELDSPSKMRDRNLQRLDKTQKFLAELPEKRSRDIVLVLDEPESWFQLRPEVLLQRYLDMNDRANRRLEQAYGGIDELDSIGIRQNVIFTASKMCASNLTAVCNAFPQAPEPLSARFLGAGLHIGRVREMRSLYEHAAQRARNETSWNSVQALMTIIHSEQELQRKRFLSDDITGLPGKDASTNLLPGEFTIGLDHNGTLSFPVSASEDLAFSLHQPNTDATPLSDDIIASERPYWTVPGAGAAGMPDATPWTAVPLLSHKHIRTVPAVIHVNERHRAAWWPKFWMAAHTRSLFDQLLYQDHAAAIVIDPRTGVEEHYWAPSSEKPGFNLLNGQYTKWVDSKCNSDEWAEEIFRDGKGRWESIDF